MIKIESLTKEQEIQLIEFREEWRKHALSCERIDKEATKNCILELYKLIGKKSPVFIFCPSLLFAQYQIEYCKNILPLKNNISANLGSNLRDNIEDNIEANLWANLRDILDVNLSDGLDTNLRDNLRDNLMNNLRDNLRVNLYDTLRVNLRDNLRYNLDANLSDSLDTNLWANIEANLSANLGSNLRDNLRVNLWVKIRDKIKPSYVYTNLLGSMDAFWISFYEFPEKFLGVEYKTEYKKILNIWSTLAKSCSWFWCYENYCFVSDRPEKLSFNTQNKLHCEDAPAVKWIDGWEIYYWNGTEVPKQWIVDKNSITKETIIKEKNAEKRRCIREIIGTKQYANLIDIKEIDKDHVNGQDVILYRTKEKDDIINEHIYYVNVTCHSTLREYFLCIPKEATKNAWSAVAWTFKMNEQEYKPIIET